MPISSVDTIPLAFRHTKQQLLQPFRFGQWNRLAIVGLLAGELGSSGGCSGPSNFNIPHHPGGSQHFLDPGLWSTDPALFAALTAVLVVAGLLFGILLMYVSSVMRFILFDSVVTKECHIRQSWTRRQAPGLKYFLFKLLYLLTTLGGVVILVGIPAAFAFAVGWLKTPKEHLLPLIFGGIVLFFLLLGFVLALAIIFVFTKDFVVPQMALENISVTEGWRRLWGMIKAEKGVYAGYLGMKIVMAIGAAVMVGIAAMILGLVIAIPTIGLSILAVLTGKSAGLTWNAFTITLAVVVGSILLAGFLYLVSLLSVPVIVFFPAYSIYFFAARYPALAAVLYQAPPAPTGAFAVPPFEPPPIPPEAAPIG